MDDTPRPTTIEEGIEDARRIVRQAIRENLSRLEGTFLLLSGGNDSMVLFDVCKHWADAIVHINTGVGIPATSEFVRQIVAASGEPFIEEHPPIAYEDLVLGRWNGFPGPGAHIFTYTMLKERCVEKVLRDHRTRRGDRFLLLTGARASESKRRMGTTEEIRRNGGQVWVNPLLRWSNELMREYRETCGLPVNPVTEHLHMSGECLCGAFAKPGELDHIGFFYPEFEAWVRNLERRAREQGLAACRWGEKPPKPGDMSPGPMCSDCTVDADDMAEAIITTTSVSIAKDT